MMHSFNLHHNERLLTEDNDTMRSSALCIADIQDVLTSYSFIKYLIKIVAVHAVHLE